MHHTPSVLVEKYTTAALGDNVYKRNAYISYTTKKKGKDESIFI